MKKKIRIGLTIFFSVPILLYLSYAAFIFLKVDEIDSLQNYPYSFKELHAEKFISNQRVFDNIVQKKLWYSKSGYNYKIHEVEIGSVDGLEGNNIKADLWTSKDGKSESIILVLPITGANDPGEIISKYMVIFKKYDALRIKADRKFFDPKRIEKAETIEEIKSELKKFKNSMKIRIINHFRLIKWAKDRGYKNIGIIGVSLGAIEGGIVSLDKDVKASVLIIGGGDIAEILTFSEEPFVKKWREITVEKLGKLSTGNKFELIDLYKMLHEIFRDVDSLRFAGFISPHRVLLINSKKDKTVPLKSAMSFFIAANQPKIYLLDTDHRGTAWYIPYIFYKSGNFFEQRFNE